MSEVTCEYDGLGWVVTDRGALKISAISNKSKDDTHGIWKLTSGVASSSITGILKHIPTWEHIHKFPLWSCGGYGPVL